MLFRPVVESPSDISLVGGTRGQKGLFMNNSPNSELVGSRDTGPLLGIFLMEEGGSGICRATVAGGGEIFNVIHGYMQQYITNPVEIIW